MNKKFLPLLTNLLAFAALVLCIDRAGGALLGYLFERSTIPEYERISYAMNTAEQPVIILGSSRAVNHYDPQIIQDSLTMPVYNAGRNGHGLFYHYNILKAIMHRTHPKVVVLDVLPHEFETNRDDDLSALLPYYNTHPEIKNSMYRRNVFEKIKIFSHLYHYNSIFYQVIAYNIFANPDKDVNVGFVPLKGNTRDEFKTDAEKTIPVDTAMVRTMRDFVKLATQNGTRLYVFISPYFGRYPKTPASIEITKRICHDNNIPFFDYSQDEAFYNQPMLFHDYNHLNADGARRFSMELGRIVKKDLSNTTK